MMVERRAHPHPPSLQSTGSAHLACYATRPHMSVVRPHHPRLRRHLHRRRAPKRSPSSAHYRRGARRDRRGGDRRRSGTEAVRDVRAEPDAAWLPLRGAHRRAFATPTPTSSRAASRRSCSMSLGRENELGEAYEALFHERLRATPTPCSGGDALEVAEAVLAPRRRPSYVVSNSRTDNVIAKLRAALAVGPRSTGSRCAATPASSTSSIPSRPTRASPRSRAARGRVAGPPHLARRGRYFETLRRSGARRHDAERTLVCGDHLRARPRAAAGLGASVHLVGPRRPRPTGSATRWSRAAARSAPS